jgi:thiol-disulfide isomerase/thioredoxin
VKLVLPLAALGFLILLVAIAPWSAPAFKFRAETMDGEVITPAAVEGKVTLIQFWATWCGYCRRDQKFVDAVARDYADKGVVVLVVNVGEPREKVAEYLARSPRAGKMILEEKTDLAQLFEATSFPKYAVLNRSGQVAGVELGAQGAEGLQDMLERGGL